MRGGRRKKELSSVSSSLLNNKREWSGLQANLPPVLSVDTDP
jgi:hypothetical protein